eukprot:4328658-Amphidinium_carterae.1
MAGVLGTMELLGLPESPNIKEKPPLLAILTVHSWPSVILVVFENEWKPIIGTSLMLDGPARKWPACRHHHQPGQSCFGTVGQMCMLKSWRVKHADGQTEAPNHILLARLRPLGATCITFVGQRLPVVSK